MFSTVIFLTGIKSCYFVLNVKKQSIEILEGKPSDWLRLFCVDLSDCLSCSLEMIFEMFRDT